MPKRIVFKFHNLAEQERIERDALRDYDEYTEIIVRHPSHNEKTFVIPNIEPLPCPCDNCSYNEECPGGFIECGCS